MTADSPTGDTPGTGAIAFSLFPAGVAAGRSFIDRIEEYKRLTQDILAGRNAWFDCPAGYGVYSLTERLRLEVRHWRDPRIAAFAARLHAAHDTRSFCEAMLDCAGQLASQTILRANVDTGTVKDLFPGLATELYLDEKLLPTIRFRTGSDPVGTMLDVIARLDSIAGDRNCRVVFIVHDMQQILALRERDELLKIMAGIFDTGQQFTWLIHGHNRHAMRRLFLNKTAILHGHCARFTLRPIHASAYGKYLAEAAQSQWGCFIGPKATAMILALTARHPYWFNKLCRRLWSSDLPPVIQDVVRAWKTMVDQHRYLTSREMEYLSPNQRAVLRCLAETPTDQPRAKAFVRRTRVSSASVGQAIKILAERDLIDPGPDGVWTVTDPVMQWSLHPRDDIVDGIYDKQPDMHL